VPAAVGTQERCAQRIADQLAAGADGVILHASLAREAAPAVEAYAKLRPAARLAERTGRPA
jgi:5,10-methylenetetrahydromethanopterin reductase